MNRWTLIVVGASVLMLVGCEAGGGGSELSLSDDASPTVADTVTAPADVFHAPETVSVQPWCAPRATPPLVDLAPGAAELYASVQGGGCSLLRVERDFDGDGVVDETEPVDTASGAESFGVAWTEPSDMGGRIPLLWWGIARGERDPDGGLLLELDVQRYQHSARQRVVRRYDPDGEVLREEHWWNGDLWFEVDLERSDGHLARATHTDHVNGSEGPRTRVYSWSRNELGQLLEATVVASGAGAMPEQRAEWTLDPAGRPLRVVRQFAGDLEIIQSWSYGDDGRLEERSMEQSSGGWGGGRYQLDDLSPWAERVDYISYDWRDALPRASGFGCRRVPSAPGHGYPSGEGVYELGWSQSERPTGIGFDYGYGGYAYYYGDFAWFGHGGVAGGDDPLGYGEGGQVVVTYDSEGHAVREEVETRFAELASRIQVRERRFERGQLASDNRTWSQGEDTHISQMAFTYDDSARLTGRDYALDDVTIASHSWAYDPLFGGVSAHGIAHHGERYASFIGNEWAWSDSFPDVSSLDGEPPLWWVHERRYEDEGRVVHMQKRQFPEDEAVPGGELQWDDAGRLVALVQGSTRQVLAYDATGRLQRFGTDADGDGETERYIAWERGSDGRLLSTEIYSRDDGLHSIERLVYACQI